MMFWFLWLIFFTKEAYCYLERADQDFSAEAQAEPVRANLFFSLQHSNDPKDSLGDSLRECLQHKDTKKSLSQKT
jgi:hypothetical protein